MKVVHATKRLRIGIIFNFSPKWMGGIIYILNLVKAFNCLKDDEKPEIVLFYNSDLSRFLEELSYPYISFVEWKFPSVVGGYIKSWLAGKNMFVDTLIGNYALDAIYPAKDLPVRSNSKAKVVAWYADLQHKYYPEFFSKLTLLYRSIRLRYMLRNTDDLVVSSNSVKEDFQKFFRLRETLKFHVYHFVSLNDDFQDVSIDELRRKYNLPDKYFLVSNQFHRHKNHKVVLLALAKLKENGISKYLAITGKFPDASDSPYLAELHRIIEENKLSDQISLLGIIPRKDQMQIMNHAQAVLQPSLFEGWSTVIEDSISLQVPVIASGIQVNMEQLKENGVYFDPDNADELVSILSNYPDRDFNLEPYGDYSKRIQDSVRMLMSVFQKAPDTAKASTK